jgi:anti-sigma B factor antagonist
MLLLCGLSALSSWADVGTWSTMLMVDDCVGRLRVEASVTAIDPGSPVEFAMALQSFGTGTYLVSAHGDVDSTTAPELETELLETVDSGAHRVVVDLTEATFLDSSGVHVLVRTGERLQSSGPQLGIVCGPYVKRILEITGVDRAFQIHDTIENAISPRLAAEMSPLASPLRRRDSGVYA